MVGGRRRILNPPQGPAKPPGQPLLPLRFVSDLPRCPGATAAGAPAGLMSRLGLATACARLRPDSKRILAPRRLLTLLRRPGDPSGLARCRHAATRVLQTHGTGGVRREYGCS